MEKWTAADEKLYAELTARKKAIETACRDALGRVVARLSYYEGDDQLMDNMIALAPDLIAALEPYALNEKPRG